MTAKLSGYPVFQLDGVAEQASESLKPVQTGRVTDVVGTLIRASGVSARVGELCQLFDTQTGFEALAEVSGFSSGDVLLSPLGSVDGLSPTTQVVALKRDHRVCVGDFLLGRVVDGMGRRFVDTDMLVTDDRITVPVWGEAPSPFERKPIRSAMALGVRAIDGLLTMGHGQRVGIFAPAGCGKSTLMSMMCRNADVDVTIVALVGERGREVLEFVEEALTPETRQKTVLVVATSDRPPTERLKASFVATAYAEYFRSQGKSVLLLVDSVTRLARAAREIGLAAGEPATRRGFPPSVFTLLPKLFERAGSYRNGSITAFYTVLEESDDHTDPVAEEVRSLLDGAISLSRQLSGSGHFPAIDILSSISRLMPRLVSPDHQSMALRARQLLARYSDVELLLRIGEYQRGVDDVADASIDAHEPMISFLQQTPEETVDTDETLRVLTESLR
ncbi:MAG: FliI/YscN family ATPase [Burkholderiaceae bacterium]